MNPFQKNASSASVSRMKERINKLESLVALQDNTIAQLNSEVFRQQQDITRLGQRIEVLEKKLEQLEMPDRIAGNEPPPHW